MKQIETKNYTFDFQEQKLVIRKKKRAGAFNFFVLLTFIIIILSMFIFAWTTVIPSSLCDTIIMSSFLLTFLTFIMLDAIITEKSLKKFKITTSSKGIEHIDWNKTYFIPWESVMACGVITDCPIGYTKTIGYGDCIFFQNAYMTRKKFKKRMWRLDGTFNGHGSTDRVIVFDLKEKDEQETLYKKICEYIYPYCDKSKEFKCSWKDL